MFTKETFLELAKKSIAEYPVYKDDGSSGAIFDKEGTHIQINNDNTKTWPVKYVYSSQNPKSYKFSMKYNDSGFYVQKIKSNDANYQLVGSYEGDIEITEEELEDLLSIMSKEYVRRIDIWNKKETARKLKAVEDWKKELNIN